MIGYCVKLTETILNPHCEDKLWHEQGWHLVVRDVPRFDGGGGLMFSGFQGKQSFKYLFFLDLCQLY